MQDPRREIRGADLVSYSTQRGFGCFNFCLPRVHDGGTDNLHYVCWMREMGAKCMPLFRLH